MRKTYFLFLLAFVAMGSMLFIGGVQQAHALCSDGSTQCSPASLCSNFTKVNVPANATAVTTVCSQYLCPATQCNDKEITTGFTCNSGYVKSADGMSCVQGNYHAYVTVTPNSVGVNESATVTGGCSNDCVCAGAVGTFNVSYPSPGQQTFRVDCLASGKVQASDSATLTVTPPSTSYNCRTTDYTCQSVAGTGGTYSTLSGCQAACVSSPPSGCHPACAPGDRCISGVCLPPIPHPTFTIAPPSATIQVGGTQQYTGYYDPDGPGGPQASQTISASSVTWSSSNTSAATISSSGLATGVTAGSVTISGMYSGITAVGRLTVAFPNGCVSNWAPDPSGICSGTQFTQTDGSNCETPNTRTATGTGPCAGGMSANLTVNGSHNPSPVVVPYGQSATNLNIAWQASNANGCDASNSGGLRGWMQNLWNNILKAFNSGSAVSTVTQSGTYNFTINCH